MSRQLYSAGTSRPACCYLATLVVAAGLLTVGSHFNSTCRASSSESEGAGRRRRKRSRAAGSAAGSGSEDGEGSGIEAGESGSEGGSGSEEEEADESDSDESLASGARECGGHDPVWGLSLFGLACMAMARLLHTAAATVPPWAALAVPIAMQVIVHTPLQRTWRAR